MKRSIGVLIAAVILCAVAGAAQAQVIPQQIKPAYGGKSWDASKSTCFSDHFGSTNQNCAGGLYWFTPLAFDGGGTSASPSLYVFAPSAGANVQCQNWASNAQLTYTVSSWVAATAFNHTVLLTPGTVNVPENGHLFSWCWLQQGSRIHSVVW
jgi:hypothetical protein